MNWAKQKRSLAVLAVGFFVVTGTYNAVVINSESSLGTDVKFVKRLDEVYGVTISGRDVAASVNWQKLTPTQVAAHKPSRVVQKVSYRASAPSTSSAPSAPQEIIPAAAVQEELTLSLVEVINPKKYANGLPNTQFNGSLSTNNGVIENLAVSLPNGEGVSVSFSEMTGNVFEYDYNGELYSGMMYQVDQGSYMVTLTNGPLEGTRLRFQGGATGDETQAIPEAIPQEYLAENNNVDTGNFGNEQQPAVDPAQNENSTYAQAEEVPAETLIQNDQQMQLEAQQAQSYNMEQPQSM